MNACYKIHVLILLILWPSQAFADWGGKKAPNDASSTQQVFFSTSVDKLWRLGIVCTKELLERSALRLVTDGKSPSTVFGATVVQVTVVDMPLAFVFKQLQSGKSITFTSSIRDATQVNKRPERLILQRGNLEFRLIADTAIFDETGVSDSVIALQNFAGFRHNDQFF